MRLFESPGTVAVLQLTAMNPVGVADGDIGGVLTSGKARTWETTMAQVYNKSHTGHVVTHEELAVPSFDPMEPQMLVCFDEAASAKVASIPALRAAVQSVLDKAATAFSRRLRQRLPRQHVFGEGVEARSPFLVVIRHRLLWESSTSCSE